MRLFEAILDANRRALAGDSRAGVHPSDFPDALPIVALTCIDPRLNRLLPEALGVRDEDFIWLRNAGNIVFDPLSSMMRSLALACAVKGGKEIAVIGHTDCRVRQVSVSQLLDTFRALGINRSSLPDNLVEFFGLFASERQNVLNGVEHIRRSPLISPRMAVHGLLIDVESGRLEWLFNGYDQPRSASTPLTPVLEKVEQAKDLISAMANLHSGEIKFPEVKIGDLTLDPAQWRSELRVIETKAKELLPRAQAKPPPVVPSPAPDRTAAPIPLPPPLKSIPRARTNPKRSDAR